MSILNDPHVDYVNSIMKELNEMTDGIYEALMDNECEEIPARVDAMIKSLKDIKETALVIE